MTDKRIENYVVNITSGKHIEVNISAIAGKNGSGKSSLIELFYVALFNISVNAKPPLAHESFHVPFVTTLIHTI